MFTGIVLGMGRVSSLLPRGQAARLTLDLGDWSVDVKAGDSVAVNGACLTSCGKNGSLVSFDVIRETLEKTTLGGLRPGDRVNIELALRYGDRMGGHFVTGHVDGVGTLSGRVEDSGQTTLSATVSPKLARGMITKGSIALEGVSLTLIGVTESSFSVGLIPETLKRTTLGERKLGDRLNVETDHLGKWVASLCAPYLGENRALKSGDLESWGY